MEEGVDLSEPAREYASEGFPKVSTPPLDPVANGGGGSIPIGVKFGD